MATLDELRKYMQDRATDDLERRSVQVTAGSIEEALKEASVELGLPVKKLEYEILERGSQGIVGINKKNYMMIVYEAEGEGSDGGEDDVFAVDFDMLGAEIEEKIDKDSVAVVHLNSDDALLRATTPEGDGIKATVNQAIELLARRGVENYDNDLVARVVNEADGQFVRVGEYSYNPANDSVMAVNITDSEMRATMTVRPPGAGGIDQTAEAMVAFLKNNGIIHGILEDKIADFEGNPVFDQPVVVAEGIPPKDGQNAKVNLNFDPDKTKVKLKEKNGRVDFKEMNLVQNAVEGQILAKKTPPTRGESGRTVTGKLISTKDGKEVQIGAGKNVEISDDGLSARATINGQVIVVGDRINVEPIYVIQGDVNLKSGGNVIFLGTVLVKGSVDDGFKVKASGNIEVLGNVGKAELDAEGDIIVHQGITGKGGGSIRSGKSIWAKFIENGIIEASDFVVASDGIINSNVVANKKIVCQGKRATIVGGSLKAAEEIHAKAFGSVAGSETILEVGYDPHSKEKLCPARGKNH